MKITVKLRARTTSQ